MGSPLKLGVVRSITRKSRQAEVVVCLNAEQWVVAKVDVDMIDAWRLNIGQAVLIDSAAGQISIHPQQELGRT